MNRNHLCPNQLSVYHSDTYSEIYVDDLDEEPHSFTTAQLKLENWEYINDFEDSEGEREKEEGDECKVEKMEKMERCEKFDMTEREEEQNLEKPMMGLNKFEMIDLNDVKIEEDSLGYPSKTEWRGQKHWACHKKIIKKEREYNISSLKNISFSVCDFVNHFHNVRLPELMEKFIKENPQYAKNLRRRMYDVINVLASANIIKKKGCMLGRNEETDGIFRLENGVEMFEKKNESKIDGIKEEYQRLYDRIGKKRIILAELEIKKRRLAKLCQRNMALSDQMKEQTKISFPIACYVANPETFCKVGSNSVQVLIKNNSSNQGSYLFFYEKILSVMNFQRNKKQIAIKAIQTNRAIKGVNICKGPRNKKI